MEARDERLVGASVELAESGGGYELLIQFTLEGEPYEKIYGW